MVTSKNISKKFALISLYNKKNLNLLCKILKKHKYNFISTGSTYNNIKALGYNCNKVADFTKNKEILKGRVKTLDYKLFSSILYVRNDKKQLDEFNKLKFPQIDMVVINLYPFKDISKLNNHKQTIEMIDIGGVSLIRAASKNYKYVTVISNIEDYRKLKINLEKNNGYTDLKFREKMAINSFITSSKYDRNIVDWFNNKSKEDYSRLRYGENPHQKSYINANIKQSISKYQLNGKKISYNNVVDVDSGLKCLAEFDEPTCIILKHTNPCGVSSSININRAFNNAYISDSTSAFGGIVLLNRKVNIKLANTLYKYFFEIIVAPDYDLKALNLLKNKKNLIIFKINKIKIERSNFRSTSFGALHQDVDKSKINKKFIKLVSNKKAAKSSLEDLIFSLKIVKHLKSNSIALVNNKQTLGLGIGQTSRVDSLKIAINKMNKNFIKSKFVCASDGFFPFTDSLNLLKKHGCKAIAQPFGSINDDKLINFSIKNRLSLYFTKNRLFKH